ncbi:von Willebrand factor D and EGF domain-containing protein-like [Drosophila sulfurigaster albostrigata]|uniref:von Willebrand factor D and EGF domain-containing protein-like n=1 Tax=Drosophila sulfurigaster albostrigata TaxID=89887 RepID=UPI002D21BB10|nr:von Willebrand factor D and EGF domain-containing protein-like [Drosophila sulfurigaster albostrigata]
MWRKECQIYFGCLLLVGGCFALPNPLAAPTDIETSDENTAINETTPCLVEKDPNLCTKEEDVDLDSSESLQKLREAFKEFNITLPSELSDDVRTRTFCCAGYKRQSNLELCQPICSPKCGRNRYCSKPNVCECATGYEEVNGTCRRLCASNCSATSNCADGKYCDCKEGFQMLDGDCLTSEEIELTIEDPNLCTKTIEVEINCSLPTTWLSMKQEFDDLNIPFPNDLYIIKKTEIQKFCCEGYEKHEGKHLCQPVCPANCGEHSFCGESGLCECELNYQVTSTGNCIKNPVDFLSNDPHLCKTNKTVTYVDQSNLNTLLTTPKAAKNLIRSKVETLLRCCHGYEQITNGGLCEPVYHEKQCMDGYQKDKYGNCEPICTPTCPQDSSCIRPEECQCNVGYFNSTSLDNEFTCEPICLEDIPENSVCVRPEQWECDTGYIKLRTADRKAFRCSPHCEETCPEFSKCVSPDICKCLPGYSETNVEDTNNTNNYRIVCALENEVKNNVEVEDSTASLDEGEGSYRVGK